MSRIFSKRYLFVLLIFIAIGSYFLIRPFWRLPFDSLSVFEVVSNSTSFVIGLDLLDDAKDSTLQDQLWALDVQNVHRLLDTLGMSESNIWKEWWLLPEELEQKGAVTYTFIGNGNSSFSAAWRAAPLGIPMNFGDGEVYGFWVDTDDPLYFARAHNLLIVGMHPFQIEEILGLLKNDRGVWQDNETFMAIKNMPKENKAFRAILKNDGVLADIPEDWVSAEHKNTLTKHFDWAWLEIGKNDSIGLFSAYLAPNIALENSDPLKGDWKWIPEVCKTAVPLHLSEPTTSREWGSYIKPWLGDGGWELSLDYHEEAAAVKEIWVLPIGDTSAYRKNYSSMLSDLGLMDEIEYQGYYLKQLKSSDVFRPLSDRKGLQMWFCELDDALLCAVSREDMERWLDYYTVGGRIDKETDFLIQSKDLGAISDQQLLWRWNPLSDKETNLFSLFYPRGSWANAGQLLSNVEVSSDLSILSCKGSIRTYTPSISGPTIAWTLPLNMIGDLSLLPVNNIYTEETIAMVVQDELGDMIVLDQNANVLWEKETESQLIGPLYALPWHNNIVHLLGVTKEGLRYWDENGQVIDRWPVISSLPTSAMALAHFGSKEDVGIFIATASGQVWGFSPSGETLQGWPIDVYTSDTIVTDILHFQLPTEEFITCWSDTAGWKAFNRKGETVFEIKGKSEQTISGPFGQYISENGSVAHSRLVTAYEDGFTQIVTFTGESFNLPLGRGPADRFLLTPIWGDPRADYIVQRGKLVHMFAYEDNTFAERWQLYFSSSPDTLIDMAPHGLLSMNIDKKELWLIDENGQLLSEFPLAGEQNAFLLNASSEQNLLITLLGKELYAYRLNW